MTDGARLDSSAGRDGSASWAARARHVILGGASTGSKRAEVLYGSTTALSPEQATHYRRAWGCRFETADGRVLVDCTMALGAVALGYADPSVTHAVQEAAAAGSVAGLSPVLEVELAERLIDVVPSAEIVRFLKSGAEATSAAVRLARAATRRDTIIACGYFGWHDWSNPGVGVPVSAHADVVVVPYEDHDALTRAVDAAGSTLAAIVIEPLIHHVASFDWLRAARAHCDRLGAVLIFDEIKTAFRIRPGGVQELSGITPDLTAIGKALANGYPLAAVVGRRDVMQAAQHAWISSTLASETTALAAATAVLERHAREDVCVRLAETGTRLQQAMREGLAMAAPALGLSLDGPAPMFRLVCAHDEVLDALVSLTAQAGVLVKRGAYQFASLAHDESALRLVADALRSAVEQLPPPDATTSQPVLESVTSDVLTTDAVAPDTGTTGAVTPDTRTS